MSNNLKIELANFSDINEIMIMYKLSFKCLYNKYKDDNTSPYMEDKKTIQKKFVMDNSYYFFIKNNKQKIGMVRIITLPKNNTAEISPILILPEFQRKGFAKNTLNIIYNVFNNYKHWQLSTIKQEKHLVNFYLEVGYQINQNKHFKIKNGMDLIFFDKYIHNY